MRKVLVFQHVANEILGTLNPLLKARGFRVRYVNFDRHPDLKPSLDRYSGLVVLGGHMGVYEAEQYSHIKVEMKLIEEALKRNIPILGICLGAQMLAHALGGNVRKSAVKEIGWYDLEMLPPSKRDPLFGHFSDCEKVFQIHGDTFDIPKSTVHLAQTKTCPSQIFRYGEKVYGLQCHLEVDPKMIQRWLKSPINRALLESSGGQFSAEQIERDTEALVGKSKILSQQTFNHFLDLFGVKPRGEMLGSDHAKPPKG